MLFTVITPSFNSGLFLEETIRSVLSQRQAGVELEYCIVDGGSSDNSLDIIKKYKCDLAWWVSEPDCGPASAINKGLAQVNGDVVAWLNADDAYLPGALSRVGQVMERHPHASFCFGPCPIVDADGREIRHRITRFKEFFFPLSSRFTYQCMNYISQPATFFRGSAVRKIGPLREDLVAAWDYEFFLRLWRQGPGLRVPGGPLAFFRWHNTSISGQHFHRQFAEEYELARQDAGPYSLQTQLHFCVRWGIVGMYSLMTARRATPKG